MLCLISAGQKSDSVIYIVYVYVYIYIYVYTCIFFLFHYGLSQDIEYSFLCYTGGPCCLLMYI